MGILDFLQLSTHCTLYMAVPGNQRMQVLRIRSHPSYNVNIWGKCVEESTILSVSGPNFHSKVKATAILNHLLAV